MTSCFECDQPAAHQHHVVPRLRGGTRTVHLCEQCHGLVHDLNYVGHRALVIEGQKKAQGHKQRFGEVPKMDPRTREHILNLHFSGLRFGEIAEWLNREGVPTAKNSPNGWMHATVRDALRSVIYGWRIEMRDVNATRPSHRHMTLVNGSRSLGTLGGWFSDDEGPVALWWTPPGFSLLNAEQQWKVMEAA